ncbi:MAG TPA: hypothetical protein VGS79_20020 [Puia sp.]|nr:hypothetical protein [Puia sp.]
MNTLPAKRIKNALETRSKGFVACSLTELIEHSVGNCHQPAKREIAIIYDITRVVVYKHSDRHPQFGKLSEIMFLSFDNLLRHLRMEESTFFPIIVQASKKARHSDSIEKPIPEYFYEMVETLSKAHDAIANDFELFRELTEDYAIPDGADFLIKYLFDKMKRLDREMSFHMQLENTILFPKAIALAKEWHPVEIQEQ